MQGWGKGWVSKQFIQMASWNTRSLQVPTFVRIKVDTWDVSKQYMYLI